MVKLVNSYFMDIGKPKTIKDIFIGLIWCIGSGFGFASLNGYTWQPAIIGGLGAFVILVLLPAIILNLIHYCARRHR